MTQAAPPEKPKRAPTALWKRLPLVVFGLIGVWIWQGGGGLVSVDREVVWKVPGAYATVRRVEVQLWEGDTLLLRSTVEAPNGLTLDPLKKIGLKRGRYRSELLVWREGPEPTVTRTELEVGSEPTIVIR